MTNDELDPKWETLKNEQWKADIKEVMALGAGRRLMYATIFKLAGVESLSYTGKPEDTISREGCRWVGLTLMSNLQDLESENYLLMIKEAVNDAVAVKQRASLKKDEPNG